MEQKVPGGRKASTVDDEYGYNSEPDERDPASRGRLGLGHASRSGSNSLPRLLHHRDAHGGLNKAACFRNVDLLPVSLLSQSHTMDHKKKSRRLILQSFGHLVQKLLRQISTASQQSSGSKPTKSRAQSNSSAGDGDESSTRSCQQKGKTTITAAQKLPLACDFKGSALPGVVGINNHGNTCFMNAVLQCLSNTEQLVRYFVSDQYKDDIKRNNKQNAKKFGTRGELTENLATLLKSLWSCRYAAEVSAEFKATVGKYGGQYRGYAQHDAQEFLLWLLDKVHEDLNIAPKKKYRANKASNGRPDEIVAAEALANHGRCNNSFIYDLFQALYQSSLTCPNCGYHSNTFDPFLSVSLPIPHATRQPVCVTVVYLSATPKQVRIGLLLNQCATIADLRCLLANDTKIPEDQMVLVEIYDDGYFRTLQNLQPIKDLNDSGAVYAIEIPPNTNRELLSSQRNNGEVVVIAVNCLVEDREVKRFVEPVVLQVSQNITFSDLQRALLLTMQSRLYEGIMLSVDDVLFHLRLIDIFPGESYQLSDSGSVFDSADVDKVLSEWNSESGPPHLKICIQWDKETKESIIAKDLDVVEEHESVRQVKLTHQQPSLGTLGDCFQVYTQKEQLDADDAWFCSNCKKRQQGTVKSLGLWSLPKVLVIHLKRFKQDAAQRTKLNTLVTFPISGLDMSQHVASSRISSSSSSSVRVQQQQQQLNNKPESAWMTWKPGRKTADVSDQFMYDLYAVCNHYGNMQGGHYTAFCKNPSNGRWYSFNDDRAVEINESEVITRAAYLLFYQKRCVRSENVSDTSRWLQQLRNVDYSISRTTTSHSLDDLLDSDGRTTTKDEDVNDATFHHQPVTTMLSAPCSQTDGDLTTSVAATTTLHQPPPVDDDLSSDFQMRAMLDAGRYASNAAFVRGQRQFPDRDVVGTVNTGARELQSSDGADDDDLQLMDGIDASLLQESFV